MISITPIYLVDLDAAGKLAAVKLTTCAGKLAIAASTMDAVYDAVEVACDTGVSVEILASSNAAASAAYREFGLEIPVCADLGRALAVAVHVVERARHTRACDVTDAVTPADADAIDGGCGCPRCKRAIGGVR